MKPILPLGLFQPKEKSITPRERVLIARSPQRPNFKFYRDNLFESFFEIHGDRLSGDDPAISCGLALFEGIPVTVAGHVKGKDLEENVAVRFGMPNPDGYRKFRRAVLQAEKFRRPVITFIDTPGAYPGKEAEERGQGEAIANCLYTLSNLRVPVIAVITGEGGSGGALALGVADRIIMLENAVYSILSPEGFATILWKDAKRSDEACEVMKLTAQDLYEFGIADQIVPEPDGGAENDVQAVLAALRETIAEELRVLMEKDTEQLVNERYEKFRKIGRI